MKTNQAFRGTSCRISLSIATGAIALFAAALSLPANAAGPGGGSGGGPGGGGGGGGGHTETVGNNLSFPVIWGDGSMILQGTLGQASLAVPWSDTELVEYQSAMHYAYAQKTVGNVWQAENEVWNPEVKGPLVVDEIDWGDSLESVDMKVGRPVRIELSLYRTLGAPMTGFVMAMLANPSSPDEVQGAIAITLGDPNNPVTDVDNNDIRTYPSPEATVYSANGKLVVQKLTGLRDDVEPNDLLWKGDQWYDPDPTDGISIGAPQSLSFTGELNVGGKVIYGLSQGGWRPPSAGDYRVTFYLPLTPDPVTKEPKVSFDASTTVRESVETEVAAAVEGDDVGGTAVVDPVNNLTYIDIRVAGGGGGGGKPQ